MNDILELQETIERQRSRVNAMIECGIDEEDFFYENCKLDRLIEQYIELEEAQKKRLETIQQENASVLINGCIFSCFFYEIDIEWNKSGGKWWEMV